MTHKAQHTPVIWLVATYGCESWTFRKDEETRLAGLQMSAFLTKL